MSEHDKVAVITGAEGGLGTAVAHRLAADGFDLVLGHRPGTGAPTIPAAHRVVAVGADVTDPASTNALIETAISELGRIDALVALAGVMEQVPFAQLDLATWTHTLDVNLTGTYLACAAAAPALADTGGCIVTVASQLAYTGGRDCAAYIASKGGVLSLTRALARELGPQIRVNCVAPGPIETPMTGPHATREWVEEKTSKLVMGRFGHPSEVAAAVAWLISEATFVTGQTINVNGGGVMP